MVELEKKVVKGKQQKLGELVNLHRRYDRNTKKRELTT
jgi:hypothetical protein